MAIENVIFESGFIVLVRENNRRTRYAVADVLRALDIPTGLTPEQVLDITTLANHFVVFLRTLIANGTLGEDYLEEGEYHLSLLQQSLKDMGADYGEPNLTSLSQQ